MFPQPVSEIGSLGIETVGKALQTEELTAEFPGPDPWAGYRRDFRKPGQMSVGIEDVDDLCEDLRTALA